MNMSDQKTDSDATSANDAAKSDAPPSYAQTTDGQPPNAPPADGATHLAQPGDMPPPPAYTSGSPNACSYVDFCPVCLDRGAMLRSAVFERFDVLLARANQWLQANPTWQVINCETVESKVTMVTGQTMMADTASTTYYVSGKHPSTFNKSLRLWIRNKTDTDDPAPQQIGYMNIVPGCTDEGGFLRAPVFESFAETMAKFNQMIAANPIQGRVVNMETQTLKFESYTGGVDPETCYWMESGERATYFLNIIRMYFQVGGGTVNSIGTADFVPAQLEPAHGFSMGRYESLGETTARANAWITQQPPNMDVTNIQTIDYKVTHGGESIDTMRSLFYESGKMSTFYLRIIRAYWVQGTDNMSAPPRQTPLKISYRTFLPAQLTTGSTFIYPERETQVQTVQRALAWVNVTGAKVISAETVSLIIHGGYNVYPEQTFTRESGKMAMHYLVTLRLFLDGDYVDPPPEALPPLPVIQVTPESGCCTLL